MFNLTNDELEDLRQMIYNQAEAVRDFFKLEIGFNIDELAKQLGGEIEQVKYDKAISEGLGAETIVNNDKNKGNILFTIRVGLFRNKQARKFSIAKEIGTVLLHMTDVEVIDGKEQIVMDDRRVHRGKTSGQISWEATQFAAALLMQPDKFYEIAETMYDAETNSYDTKGVSKYFDVTEQACDTHGQILNIWKKSW